MTTSTEMQTATTDAVADMDRLHRFVNGGPTETVELEGGAEVSTLQKLQADVGLAGDVAENLALAVAAREGAETARDTAVAVLRWQNEFNVIEETGIVEAIVKVTGSLPYGVNVTRLRIEVLTGVGSFDASLLVNGDPLTGAGPFDVTDAAVISETVDLTFALGDSIEFLIENVTGTVTSVNVILDGTVE